MGDGFDDFERRMWRDIDQSMRMVRDERPPQRPRERREPVALKTRQPTGVPAWPMLLVAGAEKAGKTYLCAEASKSDLIGRTFWFSFGEDEPDEYSSGLGFDLEIVDHDGTVPGLVSQIRAASAEPAVDGKPNMIVLDSGTRLWNLLADLAQWEADDRARRKAARSNSGGFRAKPDGENDTTPDLWNRASKRHSSVIKALREHPGPVLVTARMDLVTIMDKDGRPTKDKDLKIQTQKSLPYDVGGIIRIPERGHFQLAGVRSLRIDLGDAVADQPRDFSIDWLWRQLGLTEEATQPGRRQTELDAAEAAGIVERRRDQLLGKLADVCGNQEATARWASWWEQRFGEPITETEDLDELQRAIERTIQQRAEHAARHEQEANRGRGQEDRAGAAGGGDVGHHEGAQGQRREDQGGAAPADAAGGDAAGPGQRRDEAGDGASHRPGPEAAGH